MGSLSLFCTKMGQTMRFRFYEIIKSMPYGDSLLIVPNSIMLREAQKNDISLVNVFDAFLKNILAKDEVEYSELSTIAKAKLIEKAVIDTSRTLENLHVFIGQKNGVTFVKAGLAESLLSFRREIKNYAVNIDDLIELLPGRSVLMRDIKTVYDRYDELCTQEEETVYVDIETKYEHAIKLLKLGIKPDYKKIYFTDFYKFTPLQLQFIETLKNNTEVDIVVSIEYEPCKANGLFSTVKPSYEKLSSIADNVQEYLSENLSDAEIAFLSESFTGDYVTEPYGSCKNITIKSFVNRDAEIRSTISEIKEAVVNNNALISDFAITARDLNDYSSICRIAEEYGIPVSLPKTSKLINQSIFEFFDLLFKAAMDNAQAAKAYFKLLNCSLVRIMFKWVEDWALTMPSECYFTKRSNAQKTCREICLEKETSNSETRNIIDEYIKRIEDIDNKTISEYIELTLNILKELEIEKKLGMRSALDRKQFPVKELQGILLAKKAFIGQLKALKQDEILTGMDATISPEEYANTLNVAMSDVEVVFEKGRNDGLIVTKVVDIQNLKFKNVYILGVREGEFPAKVHENWILGDDLRSTLRERNVYLPLKDDYYTEDCYFFANAVSAALNKLCLSWFRDEGVSDLDGGESLYIGYLKSMFRGLTETAGVYNGISSEYELNIKNYSSEELGNDHAFENRYYFTGYFTVKEEIAQKEEIVQKEEKNACQLIWNRVNSKPLSATALKKYIECPLKFLAERIWGTKESVELDDTPSAAHKGTFVHDVLEHFIKDIMLVEYKGKSFSELTENDKIYLIDKLMNIFETTAQKMETNGMFGGPLWSLEKEILRSKVLDWFEFECLIEEKLRDFVPSDTEWSFGYDEKEPFVIRFKSSKSEDATEVEVRFCGKVDRIDENEYGYYVTDYKTGEAPGKRSDVQIPLYILAIAKNYKKDEGKVPLGGSFLELKKKPVRKAEIFNFDTALAVNDLEIEKEKIVKPLQSMYNGNFGLASTKTACKYCSLKSLCSKNQ